MKKGIAFPTCLSVNNCICHFSPSKNDPDLLLKEDDVVKIDLGAHIDGFVAVAAHTLVVGVSLEKKAKGRRADVILAAYNAAQATLRLVKDGKGVSPLFFWIFIFDNLNNCFAELRCHRSSTKDCRFIQMQTDRRNA